MGMAASQARLLSITCRLTDNEQSGQALSFAKERLADETEQVNTEYNNALSATKWVVLTSFDGANANYDDLTYNVLTGPATTELGNQYVVTDTKGRVLVTESIADKFKASNGDLNTFLKSLGYSLSDIDPALKVTDDGADSDSAHIAAEEKIHEAWDKYLTSVGQYYGDDEHDYGFTWNDDGDGYPAYTLDNIETPINYDGTTAEQRALYDYAVALTESYYGDTDYTSLKTAYDVDNQSMITYYQNLMNRMLSGDYFTYTTDASKANEDTHYILATSLSKNVNGSPYTPLNDASTFVKMLNNGTLKIERYSTTSGCFVSTTLSEDESIQEVKDESAISAAEIKYTQDLQALENKDNKIDLQLKQLDTEHNTLQTEYDSVKNVIDKNVEKTFSIFS